MTRQLHMKWLAALGIALSALITVSWAYISGTLNVSIQIAPASHLSSGVLAEVTPYSGNVTFTDRPSKSDGIELFQIQLGNPSFSNHIHVHFYWTNPATTARVLHNGWVQVGIYYLDPNGAFTLPDGSARVSLDSSSLWAVNPRSADCVLAPQVQNQSTLYVIGNIMNSQGQNPSGQQVQGPLEFYCQVSK